MFKLARWKRTCREREVAALEKGEKGEKEVPLWKVRWMARVAKKLRERVGKDGREDGGEGGEGGEGSEGSSRRGRVKQRLRAAKQQNTPLTGRYSSLVLEPYVLALKDLGPKTGEMLLNRFFSIVVPTMAVVLNAQID